MDEREREKRAAAEAAAQLVEDGNVVGLGTGTTVAHFLPALARRQLRIRCVATSPQTAAAARELGLEVESFERWERLDIGVDGADQVAPDGWLVKGGGGAHTREKVVAGACRRFVAIVSGDKLVDAVAAPIPLELLRFGLAATLRLVRSIAPVQVRAGSGTPDGNVLADLLGEVSNPRALAAALNSLPGVVEHGLFGPELVTEVLVGLPGGGVERLGAPEGGVG